MITSHLSWCNCLAPTLVWFKRSSGSKGYAFMSWHCWRGEEESQTDLRLKGLRLRVARTSSFYLWRSLVLGRQLHASKASFPTGCEQEDSGNQSVKVSSAMGKWLNRKCILYWPSYVLLCVCTFFFFFPFQNSCLSWTHILKCLLSNLVWGIPSTTHHSEQGASSHHVCQRKHWISQRC